MMTHLAAPVAATAVFLVGSAAAGASTVVPSLPGGGWVTANASGGTAEVVDLGAFAGTPLHDDAPTANGAVRLETANVGSSRAAISRSAAYGTVGSVLPDLQISFSMFKETATPAAPAPSLKLEIAGGATCGWWIFTSPCGFTTLVFEPYWQQGSGGVAPAGEWVTYDIDFNSGLFWATLPSEYGFGSAAGGGGGATKQTLAEWLGLGNNSFANARIDRIYLELGSSNAGQVGFVDNISISGTNSDGVFVFGDFEPTGTGVIPLPAAMPLLAGGLGLLSLMGWRQRRRSA
ncbi:MAG: hypothetical protein ACXIU8_16965 [Alkalilacustris sp.]